MACINAEVDSVDPYVWDSEEENVVGYKDYASVFDISYYSQCGYDEDIFSQWKR